MSFALEVYANGAWQRCETDGAEARFSSREDAETEGRWSLDWTVMCWRAVEIDQPPCE